jgi:hypothetical protein
MIEKHTSVFSLLVWSLRAYTLSWVVTFVSSIINVLWMTYVFRFDFVSSVDGALANQIGIVLLNELYLLVSVLAGWKVFFSKAWLFNLLIILISAAFIGLLLYAPIIAFNLFAHYTHAEITGHSPLYDRITGYAAEAFSTVDSLSHSDIDSVRVPLKDLFDKVFGVASAVGVFIALLIQFLAFGRKGRKG